MSLARPLRRADEASWPAPVSSGYVIHPVRGLQVMLGHELVRVHRLSLHDAEVRAPNAIPPGDDVVLSLRAPGLEPVFGRARAIRNRLKSDGWVVEIGILWHGPEDARRVGHWLADLRAGNLALPVTELPVNVVEVRDDRSRNLQLLRALAALHRDVHVRAPGWRLDGAELPPPDMWPKCAFEVDIYTALVDYCFRLGPVVDGEARDLGLMRVAHRTEARARAPVSVRVRGVHPLFPNGLPTGRAGDAAGLNLPVRYLSQSRISCACDLTADFIYPGLELPYAEVSWKGGRLALELRVVSLEDDEADGVRCVFEVSPDSVDFSSWCHQASRVCHPHTFVDGRASEELYDLYGKSGYFHISGKAPGDFEADRADFAAFSRKLSMSQTLGSQVTWRSLDGLDGTVTFLNAWSSSSLIYQLAREHARPLALSGHRALFDLYVRATEHTVRAGMDWYVVYVQHEGARFSRLVNRDFPALYADGVRAVVEPFRAWEVRTSSSSMRPALDIREPTSDEIDGWLNALARTKSPAYLQALDLESSTIEFKTPHDRFQRAGIRRERVLRTALAPDGRILAIATFEHIDSGAHLFGLLDCVRVYVRTADATLGQMATAALLANAQLHYGDLGKDKFVYMETFDDQATERPPIEGAVNLGDADMACFRTDLSIELVEQVARAVGRPR